MVRAVEAESRFPVPTEESALVRAFVGVVIDETVRVALSGAVDLLRKCHARMAWVPAENMHISLAFLGNVPRPMLGEISNVLDRAAQGTAPFSVSVSGIGTFGQRVVWAGVDAPRSLFEIQRRVAEGVRGLGIQVDDRPYRPHVTLGRIKSGASDLTGALRKVGSPEFGVTEVRGIALMRSELRAGHALYTLLHAAAL